jgi:general stress protein 26
MKRIAPKTIITAFVLTFLSFNCLISAQEISRDSLISGARDIIKGSPFCALVTIDSTGQPQVRTMNPFPIGDDMVIWFATGRTSRKVGELKNNQKVAVYYSDQSDSRGYVTFNGTAQVIDDKELLKKMKRQYWEGIPDWQNIFVLIKITPQSMDVINYAKGISGDPKTSRSPRVVF